MTTQSLTTKCVKAIITLDKRNTRAHVLRANVIREKNHFSVFSHAGTR